MATCSACGGSGTITIQENYGNSVRYVTKICNACGGRGQR